MAESPTCPKCGAKLPADAPDAPCAACLMKIGMESWSREVDSDGRPIAQTAVQPPKFDAPSLKEIAELLPEFEIRKLLGVGGMGAVYLARQKSLDRDVALKVIKPSAAEDQTFAERFRREANALARLSHQNIVTVHDFGERNGTYFFVMEYVDGVNLRQAIREGRMEPAQALAVVPQVCDALQYAHDEGIVHRDIKPENILLDKRGRVKIADFGLAKLLRRAPVSMTLTSANQVMGTMHYMAPEQLERPLDVDHRADIYSLGVVLYELMTGDLPIGRFELPSEKSLDARLDNVVLRTLERRPERRYQNISEMKTDVERISKGFGNDQPAPGLSPAAKRRQPSSSSRSAPFLIKREGVEGAKGLARFNGERLTLEFTITEDAEWSDAFAGFKPGAGKAEIPLEEIATAGFETTWLGTTVAIQANSMDAVAKIPGNDRGRITLSFERRDREAALAFANAIRKHLGESEITIEASDSEDMNNLRAHPGMILMGLGFLVTGLFLLVWGFRYSSPAFMWPGLGILIGGASITGGAFSDKNRIPRFLKMNGSNFVMATIMFVIGMGLMVSMLMLGRMRTGEPLMWIGMGLALGGCSTFGGAWPTAETEGGEQTPRRREGAAGPPPKPDASDPRERMRLQIPSYILFGFGLLNVVAALFAVGLVTWLTLDTHASWRTLDTDTQAPMTWVVLIALLASGPNFIFGMLIITGSRRMASCKSYGWALTAAILCMLPLTAFWILSFFFGVWALIVLSSVGVKREFEIQSRAVKYA